MTKHVFISIKHTIYNGICPVLNWRIAEDYRLPKDIDFFAAAMQDDFLSNFFMMHFNLKKNWTGFMGTF